MTDFETQYNAVFTGLAWFDRSDVGKIAISGTDRFTWLQGMVSNDVRRLGNGASVLQTAILDATGHVLADLSVLSLHARNEREWQLANRLSVDGTEPVLADLDRESVPRVLALLDRFLIMEDVTLTDVSAKLGCFAFQGRMAIDIWEQGTDHPDEPLYGLNQRLGKKIPANYTGAHGFNAYFFAEEREALRTELTARGFVELGPEVQEVLRVEAGIPKYGVDMDSSTLAPEAGLMKTHISLTKGCYVGQEIVARIDSRGHTNRALTGLVFAEGEIPASGDKIYADEEGGGRKETGRVTSAVSASPARNGRPIALGYVRHEHRTPGANVYVEHGGATLTAEVVELPFRKRTGSAEA